MAFLLDVLALESYELSSSFQGLNEGDGEEKERILNGFDKVVNRLGNRYRLYVLGDLDGWVRDRVRVGITDAFVVPRENNKGRRVVGFCEKA